MKIQIPLMDKSVYLDAYFPKKKKSDKGLLPAVLICPGGGYQVIGTTEGRPVADKFTDAGYAAFILHYSVGKRAIFGEKGFIDFAPMLDLKAAMRFLHENAETYGIDEYHIVLAGFSAGGHLAAAYCYNIHGATASIGTGAYPSYIPSFLILSYAMGGGIDSGGHDKPQPDYEIAGMPYSEHPVLHDLPVFFWHAKDDQMVPYVVSERLDKRLTEENIPHEFLTFEHGIHARPFFDPSWFPLALDWIKNRKKTQ